MSSSFSPQATLAVLDFCRERTLATLASIEGIHEPPKVLGWRPGPNRAHIAWQLMHIGITEELFATERFLGSPPRFADLLPRFRGGSTPDDQIASLTEIRSLLVETRTALRRTIEGLTEVDLQRIPPGLAQRQLTIGSALKVLVWHEAHHQGQVHLTLNLYRTQRS